MPSPIALKAPFERHPCPHHKTIVPVIHGDQQIGEEYEQEGIESHNEVQGHHMEDIEVRVETEMRIH